MKNIMLVEAEIWTVARTDKGNAVLVKPIGSERAVPIFIGQLEAQSILIGLGNVPMPRPLSHDLFVTMMEKLNATIDRVDITELKDGTFYARIVMKQGLKKIVIDSRPSDALGITARIHCPLYIAESIVEEAGIAINLITEEDPQVDVPDPREIEKSRLEQELQKAVEDEDYEEAARIRDKMNELS
ncbi:MAG TPA: bifunctional nuclease family protein [Spirochaetia bacterium]|jgi:bifunctional DNase/RNase|nr:bifunctional nuclease family protein [Spirochaetia bacterium]